MSLRNTIETGAPIDRDHVFIQFDGNGARGNFQRAIVKGQHKLIVDIFKDEIFFELYDLVADPQEKYNLAFKERERVENLSRPLTSWMRDTKDLVNFGPDAYDSFLDAYGPFQDAEPSYPIGKGSPSQIGRK